jgi:hypothetical protein
MPYGHCSMVRRERALCEAKKRAMCRLSILWAKAGRRIQH